MKLLTVLLVTFVPAARTRLPPEPTGMRTFNHNQDVVPYDFDAGVC